MSSRNSGATAHRVLTETCVPLAGDPLATCSRNSELAFDLRLGDLALLPELQVLTKVTLVDNLVLAAHVTSLLLDPLLRLCVQPCG